jgi:hypothetical protein
MNHFTIEDCVDFVRGVDNARQTAAMKMHLNDGCPRCLASVELWRSIVNCTKQEKGFEPPAWAVRAAEASFALRKVIPFPIGQLELATLVSDSSLQPVAAGVRGGTPAVRQLLYKSGSICIDMRMQPKPGSDSIVLMGQLLDSAQPDHGLSGIPVSLLGDSGTLSRNKTNEVGEFDFGIDTLSHLQLVFGMSNSRTIVVPVPDGDSSHNYS